MTSTHGRYGGIVYALRHYFISCEDLTVEVDCTNDGYNEITPRGDESRKGSKTSFSTKAFRAGISFNVSYWANAPEGLYER